WAVLDLFVDDLLVAVEAEIVLLVGDILFGHAEALLGTGTFPLVPAPFPPAGERVRQVVLVVLVAGQRYCRSWAELLLRQQRGALIIQAPAVGGHLVEPDWVGSATVGAGEQQDRGGDSRLGLEHPAGHL